MRSIFFVLALMVSGTMVGQAGKAADKPPFVPDSAQSKYWDFSKSGTALLPQASDGTIEGSRAPAFDPKDVIMQTELYGGDNVSAVKFPKGCKLEEPSDECYAIMRGSSVVFDFNSPGPIA